MKIKTAFEKISGDPLKVGVGVITQLNDPERAFVLLNSESKMRNSFVQIMPDPPQDLRVADGLLSLTRARQFESQIGSDASTLLWIDKDVALQIESPRVERAEYPNHGSSVVIFTSKDPFPYVELETFGPLTMMKTGDRIERTNTYTLMHRRDADPVQEAKRILLPARHR
jgi:hypothetical protein